MFGHWLLDAGAALFAVLLLLLVRATSLAYALIVPPDAEAVPLLHLSGLFAGIALGLALLVAAPHRAAFLPGGLYDPRGEWARDAGGFLAAHLLPRADALIGLFGPDDAARALAGAAALLLLTGGLVAWRGWRRAPRLRAFAGAVVLALATAVILHYGAHLLAWTLHRMNFWLFLVALVLFQAWRARGPAPRRH